MRRGWKDHLQCPEDLLSLLFGSPLNDMSPLVVRFEVREELRREIQGTPILAAGNEW